jgi:hypothetical protein
MFLPAQGQHKNPIKDRWPEPSKRRQKGRPKDAQPAAKSVENCHNFKKVKEKKKK